MTKKHFETIAKTIKASLEAEDCGKEAQAHIESLARCLSWDFKEFNPNFDRERFLKACGV